VTPGEREHLIRSLFPLVRVMAKRILRIARLADVDDLIGDGCIGLIRAVDTFDARRGPTLESYAKRLIAGAMLNGLRRRDSVSERVRRTMRRAEEERFARAQEIGTLPTLAALERDDPALRRARYVVFAQAALSIDAPLPGGRDPLADWSTEPSARAIERDRMRRVAKAIALLPERERRVLALHYAGEESLHAIGRTLRVSPQRVSQLHVSALERVRRAVANA
jgi:RNA polymerase sigma factor for flagellar operon FliA